MVSLLRFPAFRAQTFASLQRHRNYRLYFAGQFVSQLGTWLQNAGQSWLILDLTHSPAQVGVFAFWMYLPYAAIGLFGGALADRYDRRRMLMISQTAMAACSVALAVVAALRLDAIWVIDAIGFVRGIVLVFNNPARQALIVELVGRGELANAIALNSSLNNAARIGGPALAGVLIATTGLATCFALNALSFIAVLGALGAMRTSEMHYEPRATVRADARRHPRWARLCAPNEDARRRVHDAQGHLDLGDQLRSCRRCSRGTRYCGPHYGFITAFFGLGAFTGALVSASRRRASPRLLLAAAGGFGLAQLLVAFQDAALTVAISLYATGVCYTIYTSSTNALVQLATPGYLQGRTAGLYSYVFLATAPLGSLAAGWFSPVGGARLTLPVAGVAIIVMTAFGFALQPWPMPTGTVRPRRRVRRPATP